LILGVKMAVKKSDDDDSKDEVMIHKVIHVMGGGSSYSSLTKTNYYN
jgi:hypothetical protein